MIDKIAVEKLNAFFKENTLTAQASLKDASKDSRPIISKARTTQPK